MEKIKFYTRYSERKNQHFHAEAEIVPFCPSVGDRFGYTGIVKAVCPALMDCEQPTSSVYDYDFYELTILQNADTLEDETEEGVFEESAFVAVEKEDEGDCVENSGGHIFSADEWDAVVEMMDDEIRERLHIELYPCSNQEFFDAYAAAHSEKYGEQWELDKSNPVW